MMCIEPITKELLPSLAALEAAVFEFPWSERSLELLTGAGGFGFAAVEDGTVVSYGGVVTAPGEGEVTNIATLPAFRRRGLAAAVLAALSGEARVRGLSALFLEVRRSNAAAKALYEKFGFAVVGCRKGFYHHPREDALVMRKELNGAPTA